MYQAGFGMAEKPDYYEVLGVGKTATADEIKKAYQKIVMRNHPDVIRNKPNMTEAQKEEASLKFKHATEAESVLTDPAKRAAYDQYGHKGVENLTAGKGASSGQSYTDAAGPAQRKTYSEEDTFSFFERRAAAGGEKKTATPETDRSAAAAARRQRRAERQENGGFAPVQDMPSAQGTDDIVETHTEFKVEVSVERTRTPSAADSFRDATETMSRAGDRMRDGAMAEIPLEDLEAFRENLRDFAATLDRAISRARKSRGPSPGK